MGADTCSNTSTVECIPLSSDNPSHSRPPLACRSGVEGGTTERSDEGQGLRGREHAPKRSGGADQTVRARPRPAGAESREERPSAATKGAGYQGANTRRSEAEAQIRPFAPARVLQERSR